LRAWLAALTLIALCDSAAFGQSLDCSALPQTVCESGEVPALESERSALIAQLTQRDPENAALVGEQTWLDGLTACGEDLACYKSAYGAHNQALRQAIEDAELAPLEPLPDAASIETPDENQESVATAREERASARNGVVYVPSGVPGWGFFVAIGVTLLLFNALLRARAKHRRELRAERAQVRGGWR
jgi:uncharacterized protein